VFKEGQKEKTAGKATKIEKASEFFNARKFL